MLLADDHRIFRDGLKLLLSQEPGLELVAELGSLHDFRTRVAAARPDLVLLDYHMPGGEVGAEVARLKEQSPAPKVIILTGSRSSAVLTQLIALGADGVLLKDAGAEELRRALHSVRAGQRYVSPEVARLAAEQQTPLTAREVQIMKLACDGLSNKEIAARLHLSPKTTDKHRENLMRKLGVGNVVQLVKKAFSLGLAEK